jgi:hypothetical protein
VDRKSCAEENQHQKSQKQYNHFSFPSLSIVKCPVWHAYIDKVERARLESDPGTRRGAPPTYFLTASFTFSPACFKLPAA